MTTRQMSFTTIKAQVTDQMTWKDKLIDATWSFVGGVSHKTIPLPDWVVPATLKYMVLCADQASGPHLCPANWMVTKSFGGNNLCWDHWHELVPELKCHYPSPDHVSNAQTFKPWELESCASCKHATCEEHTNYDGPNDDPLCPTCYGSVNQCYAPHCSSWTWETCEDCGTAICGEHTIECADDEDEDHTKLQCIECASNFSLPTHIWGNLNVESASTNWKERWDLAGTRRLNPTRAAADYYLLLALRDDLLLSRRGTNGYRELAFLRREAAEMLATLVEVFDPVFCRYTDMVVGGELRYAHITGLPGNRTVAWSVWHQIRAQKGLDALTLAASRFRSDFAGNGSFGGPPWATIAETLHYRLSGRITPELFLDRVFNLQHNCGMLLNKVSWGGNLAALQQFIGPYHAADPPRWSELLSFASAHVWDLWSYYRDTARSLQIEHREPVDQLPRLPRAHEDHTRARLRDELHVPYSDYVRTKP